MGLGGGLATGCLTDVDLCRPTPLGFMVAVYVPVAKCERLRHGTPGPPWECLCLCVCVPVFDTEGSREDAINVTFEHPVKRIQFSSYDAPPACCHLWYHPVASTTSIETHRDTHHQVGGKAGGSQWQSGWHRPYSTSGHLDFKCLEPFRTKDGTKMSAR